MSAIIGGKKCKGCGNKYWTSFGHPAWYDAVVFHKQEPSEKFKDFRKVCESGLCLKCYTEENGVPSFVTKNLTLLRFRLKKPGLVEGKKK